MQRISRWGSSPGRGERGISGLELLSAAAANAAAGTLFAWSILLPALSARLDRPVGDIGPVFSTGLVAFTVAVLLSGAVIDRYGVRRATVLAASFSGGGLCLGAYAGSVLLLHLGIGVLFGFGSGLAYLSAVSWATAQSGHRRTWAVSVVVASYAAGPVVAAPLAGLGDGRWGSRATLLVAAVTVGSIMMLASGGLPGRPTPSPQADGVGSRPTAVTAKPRPVGAAVAMAALWVFSVGAFAPGLLGFAFAANIVTQRGMSSHGAGVTVALMAVANVAGRLMAAPLARRLGIPTAMATTLGATALALVALAGTGGAVVSMIGLSLLGASYGMTSALLPLATREVSEKDRFATAYGRIFSSWGVAGLWGPAVGAALHEEASGYSRGFEVMLLSASVAAVALVVYNRRLRTDAFASPRS